MIPARHLHPSRKLTNMLRETSSVQVSDSVLAEWMCTEGTGNDADADEDELSPLLPSEEEEEEEAEPDASISLRARPCCCTPEFPRYWSSSASGASASPHSSCNPLRAAFMR